MSDLPPVGELVQITTGAPGRELLRLAAWDGRTFQLMDGSTCAKDWVQSWCRVLVVPDTEETRQQVALALARTPDLPFDSMTVMSLIRGAAIR